MDKAERALKLAEELELIMYRDGISSEDTYALHDSAASLCHYAEIPPPKYQAVLDAEPVAEVSHHRFKMLLWAADAEIGRRKTDWPSPFFVAFVLVASLGVAAAIHTAYPPREIVQVKHDACRDGIVQSFDGKGWHLVTIPRQSRYYDGKKWSPDYPAGHVRTIPCKQNSTQ